MKIASIATLALSLATTATAFTSISNTNTNNNNKNTLAKSFINPASTTTSTSTTRLFISSWGARGPPSRWKGDEDPDPSAKIQAYLKPPEPIAARTHLDGTVLVSGWVNNKERTDQTIFDFLNDEESAFHFTKIVAFVDDAKFAKKRLISRSSRYSGLLDKLDFTQADTPGALPTKEQLEGVTSWVVNANAVTATADNPLETIRSIAALTKDSQVKNLAILVTDAQQITDSSAALQALEALDGSVSYTIVAVGAITETPEGQKPYNIAEFGTQEGLLMSNATYSRDESLRVVAECLGLASACNKAMVFTEVALDDVNATSFRLIKGLREGGYTRPQEIDHMIVKGVDAYNTAIEEYKTRTPTATPQDEWMAQKQKELDENAADRRVRVKEEYEVKKTKEIEDIAREWAKREYFRKATSGDMPYSENEYIKSVWERALFEGDLKYRMLHGQETDERKELAEFKKKQEKKKVMALERAQAQLNAVLDEEDKLVIAGEDDDDE